MNSTHDINGHPWAKLSELKAGQEVQLDSGFPCAPKGNHIIQEDKVGLYFHCDDGRHYLRGQADNGEHCVGVYDHAK